MKAVAVALVVALGAAARGWAGDLEGDLEEALAGISPLVLTDEGRAASKGMMWRDVGRRRDAANEANRGEWDGIRGREDWEAYRDVRLGRLRESLGRWPEAPEEVNVRVTGTVEGDGFVIENLVYESRPGDWVPGNLYRPNRATKPMPGILIAHSHHQGKEQGELQDMGMTWARAGCAVLVIDQVGYGERRAHPFRGPGDYAGEGYRAGRQDYYYRYDSGMQLHLVGESLMGWMVWDLMRGIDVLLGREGIDRKKVVLLGAVAGGGDPCGITAALDGRIAAAVPFNFGGPQPETGYPLPEDAEETFNYLQGPYWESTRGLRRTAADGFFHWMIVGSVAPRRLIYGHEFSWDGERDPVWKRYERIYGEFYGARENLAVAHGKGVLRGQAPEASHCGQIGRYHRRMIHPEFHRWFGIEVSEEDEYSSRREVGDLLCMTAEARRELEPAGFVELVSGLGDRRLAEARGRLAGLTPEGQRERLCRDWGRMLGTVEPGGAAEEVWATTEALGAGGAEVRRVVLEVERDVVVPLLLISGRHGTGGAPLVIGLAEEGKQGFLGHRAGEIAELVSGGAVVCLPDLRGTGESRIDGSRGRTSGATNISVNLMMHGETVMGQRLRDLRSVLAWGRELEGIDAGRVTLWGENFVPANSADAEFKVPHGVGGRPEQPGPGGGMLALLGALFDEGIARVYVGGGLVSYRSALEDPHVYLPHDTVVPGALTAGDLSDIIAALAPRAVRLDGGVDGLGRRSGADATADEYGIARGRYDGSGAGDRLEIDGRSPVARWMLGR